MDRTKEPPLLAPSLLIRRVTRDADGTTAAGNALAVETVRYSLGECPWVPDLEVFEQDGLFVIQVDLPAIRLEEVSVSVTDDRVKVEGERQRPAFARKDVHVPERQYGRFSRTVRLPAGVDAAAVRSRFEQGVLQLTFPLS